MLIYLKIVQLVDGFTLTVSLGLAQCQNESDSAKEYHQKLKVTVHKLYTQEDFSNIEYITINTVI